MVGAAQGRKASLQLTGRNAAPNARFRGKAEPEQISKKEDTELALRQRANELFRIAKDSSPGSEEAKKAIMELFTLGDTHDFLRRTAQDNLGVLGLRNNGDISAEAGRAYRALRDNEKYAPGGETLQEPRPVPINLIAPTEAPAPQTHDPDDFFSPPPFTVNGKEHAHAMLRKTIELLEGLPAFPLSSDLMSIRSIMADPNVMEQTGIKEKMDKLGESPRFHELVPIIIEAFLKLEDKASLEKLSKSARALVSSLALKALEELKKPTAQSSNPPQPAQIEGTNPPEKKRVVPSTSSEFWQED